MLKSRFMFAAAMAACAYALHAGRTIEADYTLEADEDWSADGIVTISANALVNLNGHSLTVVGFDGTGAIGNPVGLPAGYERLEYLDASGTQYIDTGVKASGEVKVEADIIYKGPSSTAYVPFLSSSLKTGSNNTVTDRAYGLWVWPNNGNKWTIMYSGSTQISGIAATPDVRTVIEATWSAAKRTLDVNGATWDNTGNLSNPVDVSFTMYMPARNFGGTGNGAGPFRIYSVKIYNPQTSLKRNFVPARRLVDGEVGFYDMAGMAFFENLGSGEFAPGPATGRGGGELHINVASGEFSNSTVAITNTVKVVKEGGGTYVAGKEQHYTGGTLIAEGRARRDTNNAYGFGTWGTAVEVAAGAQILIEGKPQTLNGYNVTIAGAGPDGKGAIYGDRMRAGGYASSYIGSLALSDDATIGINGEDAFNLRLNSDPCRISLNGHRLTVNGNARFFVFNGVVQDGGEIVANVSNNGSGNAGFYTSGSAFSAPLVDMTVLPGANIGGNSVVVVTNLTFGGVRAPREDQNPHAIVLGRYAVKATATSFPAVQLGDAAHLAPVFDLGDYDAPYDGVASPLTFVDGAVVTVYAGTRTVAAGDRLVAWSEENQPKTTVQFRLEGEGWTAEERNIALSARGDGLYVKTTLAPHHARWDVEGEGWKYYQEDGTDYPGEWTEGMEDVEVWFSSDAEYRAIVEQGVVPLRYKLTGVYDLPEGEGLYDMGALPFVVADGATIDAKGRSLKLPASAFKGAWPFTVTSTAAGGELVVEVAGGTLENTLVSLAGLLRLTKKGAGTFVSRLAQSYSGGTYVEEGTAQPPDPPARNDTRYCWDLFKAFGAGEILVGPNGAFDMRANYAYRTCVKLAGGKLQNSGPFPMTSRGAAGTGVGALLADSTLKVTFGVVFGDVRSSAGGEPIDRGDLGGHTLHIDLENANGTNGDLVMRQSLTNGTIRTSGRRVLIVNDALDLRTTTLDVATAMDIGNTVELRDYIANYTAGYIKGAGTLNVYGTFKPNQDTFFGCTMQNGSVLDLAGRSTVFNTTCTLVNDWGKSATLKYAAGAKVTVNLAGRGDIRELSRLQDEETGEKAGYVVKWTAAGAPDESVAFVLDDATAASMRLYRMPDGLLIAPNPGLKIYVR